ncbi:MAG: cation diffusion facilitator family transporter [Desulforegulaceae bacterium]|nr:cation diffusion facilitator family transporter [Desulforegulaceae bacterium]
MSSHESTRAILYALGANLGIAAAKGTAAVITKSGSMLAETIHSLADCTNQVLLLVGMKRSTMAADENHPLGYGKVVYFWSFIVAMLLFSMGGLFSIYEGIHKLHSPEPVKMVWVALLVLGFSIVLECFSLYGALVEIKKVRKQKKFFQWIKNTRNSELLVVLGEDSAAVLGLVTAFVFLMLAYIFDNPVFDAAGSISIGVILIFVSFFLIIRMKKLLIGSSADPEIKEELTKIILENKYVEEVYHLITIQVGPYIMLACKLRLVSGSDFEKACENINELEKNIKSNFPEIKWSFMEPDITD